MMKKQVEVHAINAMDIGVLDELFYFILHDNLNKEIRAKKGI